MGQRLNIEIMKENKLLANAYYHWSGFTDCSINLALEIIKNFKYITNKYKDKENDILTAIKLLETSGAGLTDSEKSTYEWIKNFKFKECSGRNDGLISISESGMEENRYWEEARVTIHIDTQQVDFNVIHIIADKDLKEYTEEDNITFIEKDINFNKVKFEDVFELKGIIDKSNYEENYYFKSNGQYIGLIQ